MSYLDKLWREWRVAQGRVRAGETRGWPEATMAELRADARDKFQALQAEEARLARDSGAFLVY